MHAPAPAPQRPPSGAAFLDYVKALPQYALPHHALSALMHGITRIEGGGITHWAIRRFIHRFRVDMTQAEQPDPGAYSHFNAFFTRALKPDARPLPAEPAAVASPADGAISQIGELRGGAVLQAKGRSYDVVELLGGDAGRAEPFVDGRFVTIYLSPRDYHRVHMPVTGRLREMVYVPGRLYSVSPATTRVVDGLFARNERVACLFDTEVGPMALVLVGAIFVGSIETVWAGPITPRRPRRMQSWAYRGTEALELTRGSEMGRFNMGSTVIVLFPRGAVEWSSGLAPDRLLRMGEAIGRTSGR